MDLCLEIEDVKYGRMIAELFENLSDGCLNHLLLMKREETEIARFIGRVNEPDHKLTEEEKKIFYLRDVLKMFDLIGRYVKPGDKITLREADLLRAN